MLIAVILCTRLWHGKQEMKQSSTVLPYHFPWCRYVLLWSSSHIPYHWKHQQVLNNRHSAHSCFKICEYSWPLSSFLTWCLRNVCRSSFFLNFILKHKDVYIHHSIQHLSLSGLCLWTNDNLYDSLGLAIIIIFPNWFAVNNLKLFPALLVRRKKSRSILWSLYF